MTVDLVEYVCSTISTAFEYLRMFERSMEDIFQCLHMQSELLPEFNSKLECKNEEKNKAVKCFASHTCDVTAALRVLIMCI